MIRIYQLNCVRTPEIELSWKLQGDADRAEF